MALLLENQIQDEIPDAVGKCLEELRKIPTWTKKKIELFAAFESMAKREKYLHFTGDFRDYHLQTKGQHCLYDVPVNQRGALKVFAGKRIRLVCGSKSNRIEGRYFYAKKIIK